MPQGRMPRLDAPSPISRPAPRPATTASASTLWRAISLGVGRSSEGGVPTDDGRPLPGEVRTRSERALGRDLSGVRLHTGPEAAASARAFGAAAFTVGEQVVFGEGRYRPGTPAGSRLLGHELAHVAQQAGTRDAEVVGVGHAGDATEREADAAAERIAAGVPVATSSGRPRELRRQPAQAGGPPTEEEQLERASARGRARSKGGATEAMLAGAQVVYRLIHLKFPSFADSISGVGLGDPTFFVAIEPTTKGGSLNRDEGFSITVSRAFLDKPLYLQEFWLQTALAGLPSLAGPGVGSYAGGVKDAVNPLLQGTFGSTTGSVQGAPDPADAYDASTWTEVGNKLIQTTIEPSRAMRRLVDTIHQPVPKAGGGTTRWRMDCFDAVVFAQTYARWKTMSRFDFNQRYYPLQLGLNARISKTEWERPTIAMSVGGARSIPGREDEAVPVQTPTGVVFKLPSTNVSQSWAQLLQDAPIGSQVIWTNFDAQKRCDRAKQAGTDLPFCESWQAENAMKVGPDQYLAYPFGIISESRILKELAEATLSQLPAAQRIPVDEYVRKNIAVSFLRRPK